MSRRVIVTPVFEDTEAASRLFRELAASLGPDTYIVAVDDGSVRQPVDPALIAAVGLSGAVLRLRRNVGHQRAIAVGLSYVADRMPDATTVVMDSDGEDLPATIPALLAPLEGGVQIVVAQRRNRVESIPFKVFYILYKWLFQLLTGRHISFGNFMALSPSGLKRLVAMPELWTHVASTVLMSRLKVAHVPLDRGPRYAGQSKMNFSGLVLHGLRALMVFAEDVLVRVGLVCGLVAALSLLAIVLTVALKLVGFASPGWFSVALGILLLVLLQTGALTLTTLMLSGVVRNGSLVSIDYRTLIDEVLEAAP
jgi:hypothetical protein